MDDKHLEQQEQDDLFEEITFVRGLQFVFIGALIPMVTTALVMDVFVSVFSFMVIIFPIGIFYTLFISTVYLTIMYFLLKHGVHRVLEYFLIKGKARRIVDISYFLMCIGFLIAFEFPQP